MTAVDLSRLSVAAYTQGTTWWNYVTPHSRREVEGTTYWHEFFTDNTDEKRSRVRPGDWIFITHRDLTAGPLYRLMGNSIYVMQTNGRVRRLISTFNEE